MGKTGRFPKGKIAEDDEGELSLAVGTKNGVVIIDFGTPVKWFGLPPKKARELAIVLMKHADSLEE